MKKRTKEQLKENKRFKRWLIILPLAFVFVFCGATLVNQSADISRMEKQAQELQQQLALKQDDNERLGEIVQSENKDEYIEQKAREKGYGKSDETVLYDISGTE